MNDELFHRIAHLVVERRETRGLTLEDLGAVGALTRELSGDRDPKRLRAFASDLDLTAEDVGGLA